MFILKRNDITSFPFHECLGLGKIEIQQWALERKLTAYNSWMLPQIVAHYGNIVPTRLSNGLFDPKQLIKDAVKTEWDKGLWMVVNRLTRSSLVKTQAHTSFSEYSALVPIILSGQKKSRGIEYSQWDKSGIEHTMPEDLYAAAMYTDYPNLSKDELLEIQHLGLVDSYGTAKKVTSAWRLNGMQHTVLAECPRLTVTMLTQTWVAHPSIRNKYMILDPKNWDNMPDALVSAEVITKPIVSMNLPWN
jgi:hypothetical protein